MKKIKQINHSIIKAKHHIFSKLRQFQTEEYTTIYYHTTIIIEFLHSDKKSKKIKTHQTPTSSMPYNPHQSPNHQSQSSAYGFTSYLTSASYTFFGTLFLYLSAIISISACLCLLYSSNASSGVSQ